VASNNTRTETGAIPLVTVEETPLGSQLEVTPVADADEAAAVAEEAARDGDLVVVEVDSPVFASADPDPLRGNQWALDKLKFEDVGDETRGAGITVAVIDTGVKANHPDFRVDQVLLGREFLNNAAWPGVGGGQVDPNGHGTHVAGIAGAAQFNGQGIHGAAPGIEILPVRVLNANGSGFNSDVTNGIKWAAGNGADVINLSLGSSTKSDAQQNEITKARNAGVVVVAAAGNECLNGNPAIYPAAHADVIAVGATDMFDAKPGYSSVGNYVDLAAPGQGVWSLYKDDYASLSGTSMSSPHAAAAAALVLAAHPSFDVPSADAFAKVCKQLISTAVDLGATGKDPKFGYGRVDPLAAAGSIVSGPSCT
jgi:subtilisin family serine protease